MDTQAEYLQKLRGLALVATVKPGPPAVLCIDTPRFDEPADARPFIVNAIADYMHPDGFGMLEPLMARPPTPDVLAQIRAALIDYETLRRTEGAGRELWQVVARYLGVDWRTVPGALSGSGPGRPPGVSLQ